MIFNTYLWWAILRHFFNCLNYMWSTREVAVDDIILNFGPRILHVMNIIKMILQILNLTQCRNMQISRAKKKPHLLLKLLRGYRYCFILFINTCTTIFSKFYPNFKFIQSYKWKSQRLGTAATELD